MRTMRILLLVMCVAGTAAAGQMVFDYSETNVMTLLPDGSSEAAVLSYDTENPGSAWYSSYQNVGMVMPNSFQARRAIVRFDLSGLEIPPGMAVKVNEVRLRLACKSIPSWSAVVDALYVTEAWEYGDTNWDYRDVSESTAWTMGGGTYSDNLGYYYSNGNWTTHDKYLDNAVVASWFNDENHGVIIKGTEGDWGDRRMQVLMSHCPGADTSWDKSGSYASRPVLLVDYTLIPRNCQELLDMGKGLPADVNSDCYVNLADLGVLVSQWLHCTDPQAPGCDQYWWRP